MVLAVMAEKAFVEFVQERMRQRGLNGVSLAQRAGMPNTTLQPYLSATRRKVPVEIIAKIAEPLGVPFEKLCRIAAGLNPDAEELPDIGDETRREIVSLLAVMDEKQLGKALQFVKDYAL